MIVRRLRFIAGPVAFALACVFAPASSGLPEPPAGGFAPIQEGSPVFLGYRQDAPSRDHKQDGTAASSNVTQCHTGPGALGNLERACVGSLEVLHDADRFGEFEPTDMTGDQPWRGAPYRVWYRRTHSQKRVVLGQPVISPRDFRMAFSEEGKFWARHNDAPGRHDQPNDPNDGPGVCPAEDSGTPQERLCWTGTLLFSPTASRGSQVPPLDDPRSGALAVVYDPDKTLAPPDGGEETFKFQIWYHQDFTGLDLQGRRPPAACGLEPGCEIVDDVRTAWSNNGLDWVHDRPIRQFASARLVTGNVRNASPDLNAESFGPVEVLHFPDGDGPTSSSTREVKFALYYVATHERATDPIRESVFFAVSENGVKFERVNPTGCDEASFPEGCPVLQGAHAEDRPGDWDADHVGFGSVVGRDGGYLFFYSGGKGPEEQPAGDRVGKGPNGPVHGPWEGVGVAASADGYNFRRVTTFQPLRPKVDDKWRQGALWSPNVVDVGGQLSMYLLGSLYQNPYISPPQNDFGPVAGSSMALLTSGVIKQVLSRPLLLSPGAYVNKRMVEEGFPIIWSTTDPLTTSVDVEVVLDGQPKSDLCNFPNQPAIGSVPPDKVKACFGEYPEDGTGGIFLVAKGSEEETVASRARVQKFTKDTIVESPSIRFLSDADGDGVLSGEERSGDLVVDGAGEPGATVSVRLEQEGGPVVGHEPVRVDDDGAWEARFAPEEYASLRSGTLNALASQTDVAGNESPCCAKVMVEIPDGLVSPPTVRFVGEGAADEDGMISPSDGDLGRVAVRVTPHGEGTLSLTVRDEAGDASTGRTADGSQEVGAGPGTAVDFFVDVASLANGTITAVARQVPAEGEPVEGKASIVFDTTPPVTTMTSAGCPQSPNGVCYALPPLISAADGLGLFASSFTLPSNPVLGSVPGPGRTIPDTVGPRETATVVVRGTAEDATAPIQFVYVLAVNQATGQTRGAVAFRESREDPNADFAKETRWAAYFGKQRPNLGPNEQGSEALTPGTWTITAYAMDVAGNVEVTSGQNTRQVTVNPTA